ncbi:hypothetical protein COSO111634_37420 [Corallococcus soli]
MKLLTEAGAVTYQESPGSSGWGVSCTVTTWAAGSAVQLSVSPERRPEPGAYSVPGLGEVSRMGEGRARDVTPSWTIGALAVNSPEWSHSLWPASADTRASTVSKGDVRAMAGTSKGMRPAVLVEKRNSDPSMKAAETACMDGLDPTFVTTTRRRSFTGWSRGMTRPLTLRPSPTGMSRSIPTAMAGPCSRMASSAT